MSERLHIALYRTDDSVTTAYFHWALVLGDPNNLVDIYQIRLVGGQWEYKPRQSVQLYNSGTMQCTVLLPPLFADFTKIKFFIDTEPAAQGETQLLWIHSAQGRGWTCAQWVIRVLEGLVNNGLMDGDGLGIGTNDWKAKLYMTVCGLGKESLEDGQRVKYL
ncbi:hypothetical protein DFH07DRAFT_768713 [Mycena maculata]|uniref:Uncharacterized protein n=1 Tax=Mycena maculata TaxID=230809 RepID=A0AAD7NQH4_9AGAR|nr:hypothetical protein DFH07DRAFT_768713 [Mycena maculata]